MNRFPSENPQVRRTLTTVQCLKTRHFGFKTRRTTAQTTVEFALICLPFFAILFAIIDYAQIYFYDNALQNGLRECCRFSSAGSIIEATYANGSIIYETNTGGVTVPKAISDSEGNEASRNECDRWWFISNCVFNLPASNITIVSVSVPTGQNPPVETNSEGTLSLTSSSTTNLAFGPGGANDYIQVMATNTINTITPLFSYLGGYSHNGWYSYTLRVSAIVKNEPALLNFEHTNVYPYEAGYTTNPSPLP